MSTPYANQGQISEAKLATRRVPMIIHESVVAAGQVHAQIRDNTMALRPTIEASNASSCSIPSVYETFGVFLCPLAELSELRSVRLPWLGGACLCRYHHMFLDDSSAGNDRGLTFVEADVVVAPAFKPTTG